MTNAKQPPIWRSNREITAGTRRRETDAPVKIPTDQEVKDAYAREQAGRPAQPHVESELPVLSTWLSKRIKG